MKLTQIITIGIISLAISLSYCMQNKENKTTESLDKTEHKIAVKKTFLKGLTMADKEDFSKERVMLSDGNIRISNGVFSRICRGQTRQRNLRTETRDRLGHQRYW